MIKSHFSRKKLFQKKHLLLPRSRTNKSKKSLPTLKRRRRTLFISIFENIKFLSRIFKVPVFLNIFLIGIVGFIFFAIFSPFFTVKNIKIVRDNLRINVKEVEAFLIEKGLFNKNMLFLDESKYKNKISEAFPEVEKLIFREIWPATLEISVFSKKPAFVFLNDFDANFVSVSEDGYVISLIGEENSKQIKLFQFDNSIAYREKIFEDGFIAKLQSIEKLFRKKTGLPVYNLKLYYYANELHIISKDQMSIWIDLGILVSPQIEKLVLAADKIGLFRYNFDHIDLRIPGQIFYEYR